MAALDTPNDLILEVLEVLGAAPVGQPIAEEDAAKVRDAIPGALEGLNKRRVGYFGSEWDQAYTHWLALIVANVVANKFGRAFDADAQAIAEQMIRQMSPLFSSDSQSAVHF